MGTTASMALRYPAGTDRVADGALAMQHLAEDVDVPLGRLWVPPRCRIWQNAALSINNNVFQAVAFDSEEVDASAMHAPGTPSRITAVVAGYYLCVGALQFASNATSYRQLYIGKNGVAGPQTLQAPASTTHIQQVVGEVYLNVGDYIELVARQATGAALALAVGSTWGCYLHATWVST